MDIEDQYKYATLLTSRVSETIIAFNNENPELLKQGADITVVLRALSFIISNSLATRLQSYEKAKRILFGCHRFQESVLEGIYTAEADAVQENSEGE